MSKTIQGFDFKNSGGDLRATFGNLGRAHGAHLQRRLEALELSWGPLEWSVFSGFQYISNVNAAASNSWEPLEPPRGGQGLLRIPSRLRGSRVCTEVA